MAHLAGPQPAHRLQADVRVRRHLHPRPVRDVVRAVMVDEAPRADQPASEIRQQPPHLRALAERHLPPGEALQHRTGGDARRAAVRQTGRPVEVAHRSDGSAGGAHVHRCRRGAGRPRAVARRAGRVHRARRRQPVQRRDHAGPARAGRCRSSPAADGTPSAACSRTRPAAAG